MPGIITSEFVTRRNAAREELSDVVLADLGDSTTTSQHLIVSISIALCTGFLTSLGSNH
jgi:hypothetical protein